MEFLRPGLRALGLLFSVASHFLAIREALSLLRCKRGLIFSMVRREIWNRHAGQLLGPFWTVIQPLFHMVVMVFIFGVVFRQRIGGSYERPYAYTVCILCGLSAWLSLSPSLTVSVGSVTSNSDLVKQFNFILQISQVL